MTTHPPLRRLAALLCAVLLLLTGAGDVTGAHACPHHAAIGVPGAGPAAMGHASPSAGAESVDHASMDHGSGHHASVDPSSVDASVDHGAMDHGSADPSSAGHASVSSSDCGGCGSMDHGAPAHGSHDPDAPCTCTGPCPAPPAAVVPPAPSFEVQAVVRDAPAALHAVAARPHLRTAPYLLPYAQAPPKQG